MAGDDPPVAVAAVAEQAHPFEPLGRVSCPTLILHSRSEVRVPIEMARELAALIPGSRLVPLPSRNHILGADEQAWEAFLDELDRFLLDEPVAAI